MGSARGPAPSAGPRAEPIAFHQLAQIPPGDPLQGEELASAEDRYVQAEAQLVRGRRTNNSLRVALQARAASMLGQRFRRCYPYELRAAWAIDSL